MQHLPPDADLALSCQRGNLADFDALYVRHLKGVYGFIVYRVMDRMLAEDLTGQTFLKALEKINGYDPRKGAFSTWIYRIARNTVTDHYRTRHPHEDIDAFWDLQSDDDPTLDAEGSLAREQVRSMLKALPKEKRDIVIMRLWDGLSYKEIADITGKSESSLKMQFSRVIADLRTQFPPAAFALLLLYPATL
jgi:RNA polymerase sigma-70 factor, ECF subfamily